jgi:hypothetical protein
MAEIFQKLGYDFNDPEGAITPLTTESKKFLDSVPPLVNEWQSQDIADSNVGGYFKNPTATPATGIKNKCIQIFSLPSGIVGANSGATTLFANIAVNAFAICNTGAEADQFIAHTNRISGVTPITPDTATLPHYDTAMGIGKTVMYMTNKTDNIEDNSPIMGSFTSILIVDTLETSNTTITPYYNLVANSLTSSTTGTPPDEITTYTSNLSYSTVQTIDQQIATINYTLKRRREHDVNYYNNAKTMVENYQTLKQFSNIGGTENTLIQNYIGTDKLLSRLD